MDHTQLQPYLKNSPIAILNEKELQIFLLKFGSLLYLLNNKNINPTFLFLSLVKDSNLQDIFQYMSGVPTLVESLRFILISYPNLVKSKIVRENSIKILHKKQLIKNKQTKIINKQNALNRKSTKTI
jgi:hypothetical protein